MLAAPLLADDSGLMQMQTADDSRGWDAVGQLDISGRGFCTASLIAPDLVLTAAHCLFDQNTGAPLDHNKMQFLAGWRNGRAQSYREIKRVVVHPDYKFNTDVGGGRIRNDIAVLQLIRPIRDTRITPFQMNSRPRKGAKVGVVSYAHDRSNAPSIQDSCHVLARRHGTLVMSCEVDFGSSGSPVFTFEQGEPKIVSIISAKAEMDGRDVSIGTDLNGPLAVIMAELTNGKGYTVDNTQNLRRLSTPQDRGDIGAQFVRP
ncbi:trypsin-like serine protease [Sulfitobacter sp. 1151]|uniref:Serine protease n=2 Tax=Parasulfitobacter algicola TaxID=2614809 RepID=A0ABX2IPH6_9RHOB|nr:trypsin-like serine protease [Sulfitobacter algicola]